MWTIGFLIAALVVFIIEAVRTKSLTAAGLALFVAAFLAGHIFGGAAAR